MKKPLRLTNTVVVIILVFTLSGCYYDKITDDTPPDQIVSFSNDIQPIFNANCTSCHPTIEPLPDLTAGNSYNSITNGGYIVANDINTSTLYQRLLGNPGIMPPSGSLPASEINLIKNWIEQGALNN